MARVLRLEYSGALYRDFVAIGAAKSSPLENVKNQIFLGSDKFIESGASDYKLILWVSLDEGLISMVIDRATT